MTTNKQNEIDIVAAEPNIISLNQLTFQLNAISVREIHEIISDLPSDWNTGAISGNKGDIHTENTPVQVKMIIPS